MQSVVRPLRIKTGMYISFSKISAPHTLMVRYSSLGKGEPPRKKGDRRKERNCWKASSKTA